MVTEVPWISGLLDGERVRVYGLWDEPGTLSLDIDLPYLWWSDEDVLLDIAAAEQLRDQLDAAIRTAKGGA